MKVWICGTPSELSMLTFFEFGFEKRQAESVGDYVVCMEQGEFFALIGDAYAACISELREDDALTGEFEPPYPGASDYPNIEKFVREHPDAFGEFVDTFLKFDILRLLIPEESMSAPYVVVSFSIASDGSNITVSGKVRLND